MMFGALSGFEYVAIFAGECRNPGAQSYPFGAHHGAFHRAHFTSFRQVRYWRSFRRTAVDVVGPISNRRCAWFACFRFRRFHCPAGDCSPIHELSQHRSALYFSASTRLPMVAGWDHLLPEWFHSAPRAIQTPVNSIIFLGAFTLAGSVVALIGVGPQEAYELLLTWSFTFYAIAYLALFAIPFLSPRDRGLRPRWWLRLAAVSGFLMTLLYVVLSIFPIVDVTEFMGIFDKDCRGCCSEQTRSGVGNLSRRCTESHRRRRMIR